MIIIKKYIFLILVLSISMISNAQNVYLTSKINYDKGLYESAISDLDKYISAEPKNENAYFIRGKAKFNLQKYQAAINDFSKITRNNFAESVLYIARANAALNNKKEAISYLKKYLKLKRKLPEEKIIAYPELGYIADSQEWEQLWAEKWYSKKENLLQNAENELNARNYQSAESLLNEYVVKYKANSHAFYLKAKLSVFRENDKEAIAYLDKAIELEENIDYIITKAQAEYRLKRYKKSLKTFNNAFAIDSLNLEIFYGRSAVYSALNEHNTALADINKYLYYYPDKAKGLEQYAKISQADGDFLTAINMYGKLIKQYPGESKYLKERADAYMATHTYRYAIKDYSMALDLYPRDAEIYFQKGNAHFKLNEVQKACSEWKKAQRYGSMDSQKLIYKYCR